MPVLSHRQNQGVKTQFCLLRGAGEGRAPYIRQQPLMRTVVQFHNVKTSIWMFLIV